LAQLVTKFLPQPATEFLLYKINHTKLGRSRGKIKKLF
jgi:hypothetical protein